MKNKITLTALLIFLSAPTVASVQVGDVFQIYDDVHNVSCTYSINEYGYATSEDPAYIGTGVCWDKRMMDKADFHIRSHKK